MPPRFSWLSTCHRRPTTSAFGILVSLSLRGTLMACPFPTYPLPSTAPSLLHHGLHVWTRNEGRVFRFSSPGVSPSGSCCKRAAHNVLCYNQHTHCKSDVNRCHPNGGGSGWLHVDGGGYGSPRDRSGGALFPFCKPREGWWTRAPATCCKSWHLRAPVQKVLFLYG